MPQSPRLTGSVLNSLLITKGPKDSWAVLIRGQLPSPPQGAQVGRVTPSLVSVPTPSHSPLSPNSTLTGITRPSKVKGKLLALKGEVLVRHGILFAWGPYHSPGGRCVTHCTEH